VLKSATLADHIPFVSSENDCEVLRASYSDSAFVRVAQQSLAKVSGLLPASSQWWVDPEIDGLHRWPDVAPEYKGYIEHFAGYDRIVDTEFQRKPTAPRVRQFIDALLDACAAANPGWLSVPQLPLINDSGRNKINRELAKATGSWAASRGFRGNLVLPVIITHQDQLNLKTARSPKIGLATQCHDLAGAKGIWVVDSSLMDQEGSKTLERTRFPGLISFHEELVSSIQGTTFFVGGPYWGMNLVMWCKGLINYPAIGLGNRYQYHLAGGRRLLQGKSRVALDCLKRLVAVSRELQSWLSASLKMMPPSDPAHIELSSLLARFPMVLHSNNRPQIAHMYKKWIDSLASVPVAGRSLTLYQQLSSSYVLGKSLADLPEVGTARRPERVAQQLMLVCL
jgi:hypothetical protein